MVKELGDALLEFMNGWKEGAEGRNSGNIEGILNPVVT
ncbi:hypothetical protein ES705_39332 [subsurface metagenome]